MAVQDAGRGRRLTCAVAVTVAALWMCGCLRWLVPEPMQHDSSLERLLYELALEKHDLGAGGVRPEDRDPFLLRKVDAFLQNPLQLVSFAEEVSGRMSREPAGLASLTELSAGLLELELLPAGGGEAPAEVCDSGEPLPAYLQSLYQALADGKAAYARATAGLSPDELAEVRQGIEQYLFRGMHREHIPRIAAQHQLERVFQRAALIDTGGIARACCRIASLLDALLPELAARADTLPAGRWETALGPVVVGGRGDDTYEGAMPLIVIDPAGNDTYCFSSVPPFHILIDLSGNDRYEAADGAPLPGSGIGGIGFLIDLQGDDRYRGTVYAGGAGLIGAGVLADFGGNDRYTGAAFCQGAGAFGIGMHYDAGGDDRYQCDLYGQGFGFTGGAGLLVDGGGTDEFRAGLSVPDIREPAGAFQTYAQGFGLGARLFASGGVGALFSGGGNNTYSGSYFCQGASYWQALGMLIDRQGDDRYSARRYAQGAGIHTSVGVLYDKSGDDVYQSWGVSQGCGHDRAVGLLRDAAGQDVFAADWLSQGAGSSGGTGLLIDEYGKDRYAGFPSPADGPGGGAYDERLDILSIGVLVDGEGQTDGIARVWRKGPAGGVIHDNGMRPAAWQERAAEWPQPGESLFSAGLTTAAQLQEFRILPELERSLLTEELQDQAAGALAARGPEVIPLLCGYRIIKDVTVQKTIEKSLTKLAATDLAAIHAYLATPGACAAQQRFLLFVLGEIAHQDSARHFRSFAGSADYAVRAMALRGLYKLGISPAPEGRQSSARSASREERRYLGLSLRFADDPGARGILADLLADPDIQVRRAAYESLRHAPHGAAEHMERILGIPGLYSSTYRMAADIMGLACAGGANGH